MSNEKTKELKECSISISLTVGLRESVEAALSREESISSFVREAIRKELEARAG